MIPHTLPATQSATYLVSLRDPTKNGLWSAVGTGFFISPDGHLLTSRHVITTDGTDKGPLRPHLDTLHLEKELRIEGAIVANIQNSALIHDDPAADIALFKMNVDFGQLKANGDLEPIGPRYLSVSNQMLPEGGSSVHLRLPLICDVV